MNEKINVLGVNIDSFTAKEAMKETIAFLESEPVSVIDVVSVDALMQMNDLPELKEKMNEFDMILPGEKLILEAAEEPELPEEINMKLYLKMFMRYLHKNHKRLYLLVESEEEGQEAFRYLQKAYSGIQLVGLAKVSAEGRADDMLVNAINTEAMVNVRLSFRHYRFHYRKILLQKTEIFWMQEFGSELERRYSRHVSRDSVRGKLQSIS